MGEAERNAGLTHAILNAPLMKELDEALRAIDLDQGIGAIVLTGSEKAFAGERR